MLETPKLTLIKELIAGATRDELIWLSGFIAAFIDNAEPEQTVTVAPSIVGKITIAYGTESGNSKKLATDFAAKAKKQGIHAKLVGLEQYRLTDLPKEEYFFTVISTQGDGEPPAAAKRFYDHIHQNGFRLERLKYSVLALGDTAYPLFCKAGEDVDEQLQKIGAQRIVSMQKCDTDYEAEAGHWFDEILKRLMSGQNDEASIPEKDISRTIVATPLVVRPASRIFYQGKILSSINLNDRGSAKQTFHVEIVAEGVSYEPGDSLGIVPSNPLQVVNSILSISGVDPFRIVPYRHGETTVQELLTKKVNIIYLPERVVHKYAAVVRQEIPATRIGLLDLLKIYPVKDLSQFLEVVSFLEPIAPRLYSISSSPDAHGGEIHLTVARDRFSVNGETQFGICSDHLSRLLPDDEVEFYIHRNAQFKLPAPEKDIILIGPGTGIAPFRSFLAERDSTGATGRNWLFFGDQHFTSDFLYQTEIQNWAQMGVLTRINTAFSRDQPEKIYVQHKILKHAEELYRWIESGAYIYICGAKHPMSLDVEETLLDIIHEQGNKTATAAAAYLDELKEAGRFLKDVY